MHCGTWFLATGLCFLGCRATPNTSSNHSPEPSHSSLETHATSTDTPLASPPTLSGQAATTTNAMAISIHISLEAEQAQLGHPIPLRVDFKNEGSSAVTFLEPARTWELALLVGGSDGAPEGTATPATSDTTAGRPTVDNTRRGYPDFVVLRRSKAALQNAPRITY